MKETALELLGLVENVTPHLSRISEERASWKDRPDKWSKKEILGHLIDSASTNHQRFVRACYGAAADFPCYSQNEWVRFQDYAAEPWPQIVALWSAYNRHLSHVIGCLPDSVKKEPVNFNEDQPAPLEHVVKDYLRHLCHHLDRILEGE